MAIYRVNNYFHSVTGLVKDDVVNTFHFTTTEAAHSATIAAALAGHVSAGFEAVTAPGTSKLTQFISPEISRTVKPTLKVYNPIGGSPLWVGDWPGMSAPARIYGLPGEVACCLSYNADLTNVPEEAVDDPDADTAPERPASRRRGRVYIGPLTDAAAEMSEYPIRPHSTLRNALLGFGVFLSSPTAAALTAVGTKWVVRSDSGFAGAAYPVARVSVDNSFDTQRRRGVSSTVRTFVSV